MSIAKKIRNKNNAINIKTILPIIGKFLGFLGLIFVLYKLYHDYTIAAFVRGFLDVKYGLIYFFILNFISLLFGICMWYNILLNYSRKEFPCAVAYYYYVKTEVAKYLPGNIFHFVGRQALASKMDLTQIDMVKTSTLFSIFLVIGTIFSGELFYLFYFFFELKNYYVLIYGVILSTFIIGILIVIYPSFAVKKKIYLAVFSMVSVGLQGIILGLIVFYQTSDLNLGLIFKTISIYILSWLVGFVTPGASGGLGIREATFIEMVSFFDLNIANNVVIFSVLFIRLVNIFTDILNYFLSFLLTSKITSIMTNS